MVLLKDVTNALKTFPGLYNQLPFLDAERFVRFAAHIKREIQLTQPLTAFGPPLQLPIYVHNFLCDLLGFNNLESFQCWSALKHIIWARDPNGKESELLAEEAAHFEKLGSRSLRVEERLGECTGLLSLTYADQYSSAHLLPSNLPMCAMPCTSQEALALSSYISFPTKWCNFSICIISLL